MDPQDRSDGQSPQEVEQKKFEFEAPTHLDAEEVESIEGDLSRARRRMTRSERRNVKKAAKLARYPVERCVIAADWASQRFGPVSMVRRRPDDRVAFGSGIIDLGALGLKNGFFEARMKPARADEMIRHVESLGADLEDCDPALASKVLRHAVAFAAKCGFEPSREYFVLRKFFGDPDLSEVETEVPLGHRGKPILIPGPEDDVEELASKLEAELGSNGFYLGAPSSGMPTPPSENESPSSRGGSPSGPEVSSDDDDSDGETDIIMPGDL